MIQIQEILNEATLTPEQKIQKRIAHYEALRMEVESLIQRDFLWDIIQELRKRIEPFEKRQQEYVFKSNKAA